VLQISRIPGIFIHSESRIPDPGSNNKDLLSYLFCDQKFHKIVHYFVFEQGRKSFETIDKEFLYFYPKKLPLSSQKCAGDPGSGKTYPGYPQSTASRIRSTGYAKQPK
jgi:hypothetical protein